MNRATYHLLEGKPNIEKLLKGYPIRLCYDYRIVETTHSRDEIYSLKGSLKYQTIDGIYTAHTKTECIQMFGKRGYLELLAESGLK